MKNYIMLLIVVVLLTETSICMETAFHRIPVQSDRSPIPSLSELICSKIIAQIASDHTRSFIRNPYCLTNYFKMPLSAVPHEQLEPVVDALIKYVWWVEGESALRSNSENLSVEQLLLVAKLRSKQSACRCSFDFNYYDPKLYCLFKGLHVTIRQKLEKLFTFKLLPSELPETVQQMESLAVLDLTSFKKTSYEQLHCYASIDADTHKLMLAYIEQQADLRQALYNLCSKRDARNLPLEEPMTNPSYKIVPKRMCFDKEGVSIIDYTSNKEVCWIECLYDKKTGLLDDRFKWSSDGAYLAQVLMVDSYGVRKKSYIKLWDLIKKKPHIQHLADAGCFLPDNKHFVFANRWRLKIIRIADGLKVATIKILDEKSLEYDYRLWQQKIDLQDDTDVQCDKKTMIFSHKGKGSLLFNLHFLNAMHNEINALTIEQALCLAIAFNTLRQKGVLDFQCLPYKTWQIVESLLKNAPHIFVAFLLSEQTTGKLLRLPLGSNICEGCLKDRLRERCTICKGTQSDEQWFIPESAYVQRKLLSAQDRLKNVSAHRFANGSGDMCC